MLPSEHDRVCEPAGPLIEHAEPLWDWMVHVMPASDGSGSFTVTAVAVPGPPLPTSMVKPMEVPALTGVASAVLVIVRSGDGMVRVVQFSPASPPVLFWSPSWVMTWKR